MTATQTHKPITSLQGYIILTSKNFSIFTDEKGVGDLLDFYSWRQN